MKKNLLFIGVCVASVITYGQKQETYGPVLQTTASSFTVTERLGDLPEEEEQFPDPSNIKYNNLERTEHTNPDALPKGNDPVWQQTKAGSQNKAPVVNWQGLSGSGYPSDPSGAAGPDHYVQMVNSQYRVFDKTGTILKTGSLSSVLGGGNAGDPIVLYDKFADRWLMSQFSQYGVTPYKFFVAISETNDPTGAYYLYTFNVGSTFPDYPKYSIWSDGYYITSNKGGNDAFVIERDKMLAGDASAQLVSFDIPSLSTGGFFSVLPAHAGSTLPSLGTPNQLFYFQDDGWWGVNDDVLKVWDVSVDWTTTSNSTISSPYTIPVSPFDSKFTTSWDDIMQPGGSKLDAVPGALMYMVNYREFSTYNTIVMCHTVDVNGGNRAGIRWYELRQTGGANWTLYQEGTYSPDSDSRWMGSINMDKYGNIALAYCVSGTSTYPSLRYTGRYKNGALGEMHFLEQEAVAGSGSQTLTNRWGDYAQMTIDPVDDATFWYTGPYMGPTQPRTRVFSMSFPESFLSIEDEYMSKTFVVGYLGSNQFNLKIGDLNEGVNITVVNALGQTVNNVSNINTGKNLNYNIDLGEFSAGYYIINVGNDNFNKAHKVWVK